MTYFWFIFALCIVGVIVIDLIFGKILKNLSKDENQAICEVIVKCFHVALLTFIIAIFAICVVFLGVRKDLEEYNENINLRFPTVESSSDNSHITGKSEVKRIPVPPREKRLGTDMDATNARQDESLERFKNTPPPAAEN